MTLHLNSLEFHFNIQYNFMAHAYWKIVMDQYFNDTVIEFRRHCQGTVLPFTNELVFMNLASH